jgi:aminopeptidase N
MSAWTKSTGYPIVSVIKKANRFYINQERFFSNRVSRNKYINSKEKKNLWQIPIKYESNNEIINLLLTKKSDPLLGTSIGKINKEEETFIRVKYDNETLDKLSEEIKNGSLGIKDRLGIVRDLFALAEGGYIKTDIALEFALNYKNESEYIVWSEIASGISRVYNLIRDEDFKEKYEKYALSLFSPLAKHIGFKKRESEKHSDIFLRTLAISQSAFYGDKKVINNARKLFINRKTYPIDSDIRTIVYKIVASNDNGKNWELFRKLYISEELHEEKDRLGYALTSFLDKEILKKTLSFIMSDNVKDQDAPSLLGMVWQNKNGRELTWNFIKKNWDIILKRYGEGGHFLSRLISPLGNHTKKKDLEDAKKFFTKNSAPGAERALEQVYEKIESNIAWLKDDKKYIKNWLNKNF